MGDGRRPVIADPIIILPYLGYGTRNKLTLCGRVLEDEGFRPATDADGLWRNLIRFWKRLETAIPGMRYATAMSATALISQTMSSLIMVAPSRTNWSGS